MKLLNVTALLLLVSFGCQARDCIVPEQLLISDQEAMMNLVQGNSEFALTLFGEVCSMVGSDNVFLSPYSISEALAMTWCGAKGETASQMAETLNFTMPVETTASTFSMLSDILTSASTTGVESGDPFILTIANGLWVQNGFHILDSFLSIMEIYFQAPVENLDFAENPEGARETINSSIAENTMDRILNLIPAGMPGRDTRLILTNAVYFKASWMHPFSELATSDARFILNNGSTVVVPMMNQTEFFRYGSTDEWSAVSMYYADGVSSMLIIMPEGDMEEFTGNFNGDMLASVRRQMSTRNVQLSMPRFEFTRSMPLSVVLTAMGMERAFTRQADFSGMTDGRDLFISEVLHKAFVKVDEAGTEAAAATAIFMATTGMPAPPVEMNINRPFVFLIMDDVTGSIVFMGRVMDPTV